MKLNMIINHKRASKLMLDVCQMLLMVTLAACSDDDNTSPAPQPIADKMELARINSFIDINIPGESDWKVTANPFWASPMENEGTADKQLELFVETNEDEADRTDTLTVVTTDGKTYMYVLTQMGTLRDPDNGPVFDLMSSKTLGVGFSLNVLDNTYASLSKYNVKSTSAVNFSHLVAALKKMGEEDAYFYEERNYSYTESVTGSSTDEIASQLAVNGNIDLGLEAFHATVKGAFNRVSKDSTQMMYAMQEIKHIVAARYIRSGLLRYCAQNNIDIWNTTMRNKLAILRTATDEKTIKDNVKALVETYGTHIITYAAVGGEMRISMKMKYDEYNTDMNINGALDLASKIVNAEGNTASYSTLESKIAQNTEIGLKAFGGKVSSFSVNPGATFETFQKAIKKDMKAWAEGISKTPALIDIETVPLWDIMPTEASRNAMRNYIMIDLQRQKNDDSTFMPKLFRITGYDVESEEEGYGDLSIPQINRVIEADRRIVPELSETELSTILYSGTPGNVNDACGFFVGSATRQPAKVRTAANGTVTIEPLEGMPVGAVTEVYIDATGDVTLMPKNDASLYTTLNFEWKEGEYEEDDYE